MKFKYVFLAIVVFYTTVGLHTFGFKFYWFYIPLGGIKITEGLIAFIFLSFLTIYKLLKVKVRIMNSVTLPLLLLVLLTLFQALRGVFIQQINIGQIIGKMPMFLCLFLSIPLLILLDKPIKYRYFVRFILTIGIISSLISIIQFFLPSFMNPDYRIVEGVTRSGNSGMIFSGFVQLYSLAKYYLKRGNRFISLFYFSLSTVAILFTLSRAMIFSVIISDIIIIYYYSSIIKRNKLIFLTLSWKYGLLGLFIVLSMTFINYNPEVIILRYQNAIDDYSSDRIENSQVGFRREMSAIKIASVLNTNPSLGKGFDFLYEENMSRESEDYYSHYFHPDTLNGDSTLPNLMILYGIIGVVLYVYLLVSVFILARSTLFKLIKEEYNIIALSIIPIPIYLLIISLGSSLTLNMNQIFIVSIIVLLSKIKPRKVNEKYQ